MNLKPDMDTYTAGGDIHQEFNPDGTYDSSHNGEHPVDFSEVYRGGANSPSIHSYEEESTNPAEMDYIQKTHAEDAASYIKYLQTEKYSSNLRSFVYRDDIGLNHRSTYQPPIFSKKGICNTKIRDRVPGERSNSLLGVGADGEKIESARASTGYVSPIDRGYEEGPSDSLTSPISPLDLAAFPLPPKFEHEHTNTLPLPEESDMDIESFGGPTISLASDINLFADFDGNHAPASPQFQRKDNSFWTDAYDEFEEEIAKQGEAQPTYAESQYGRLSTDISTSLLETPSQAMVLTEDDKSAELVDAQDDYVDELNEKSEMEDIDEMAGREKDQEELSEEHDVTTLKKLTHRLKTRAEAAEDCAQRMEAMVVKLHREIEALERNECDLVFKAKNCAREKAYIEENETNLKDRLAALDKAHKYARNTMNSFQVENTKLNTQLDVFRRACRTLIDHNRADRLSFPKEEKEDIQLVFEIGATLTECKLLKKQNKAAAQKIQELDQERIDGSNALAGAKRELETFRTGCRTPENHDTAEGQTVLSIDDDRPGLLSDVTGSHGHGHTTDLVQGTMNIGKNRTDKDATSAIEKRIADLRIFWSRSENLPRMKVLPWSGLQIEAGNKRIEELKERHRRQQEEWHRSRVTWWTTNVLKPE